MPVWLVNVIIALITKLAAFLYEKGLKKYEESKTVMNAEAQVEDKLEKVKLAYKEGFDGDKVTPEQRKKINKAIREFIRGPDTGGL